MIMEGGGLSPVDLSVQTANTLFCLRRPPPVPNFLDPPLVLGNSHCVTRKSLARKHNLSVNAGFLVQQMVLSKSSYLFV